MGFSMLRSPLAALAASAITLAARPMAATPVVSTAPRSRLAPRRFGDVTIRRHRNFVPKPPLADRLTVSDHTRPYAPGPRGKGRPAKSYRAARRNAGRIERRWMLAVPY
jgi:hypothetical protein